MRREYGIDLDAVLADQSIKPSVLLDLIDHLSPTSALARAVDPSSEWSTVEHMVATVIDQLALLLWVQPGAKGPRPKPLPRPGMEPDEDTITIAASEGFATAADFDRWYLEIRAGGTAG